MPNPESVSPQSGVKPTRNILKARRTEEFQKSQEEKEGRILEKHRDTLPTDKHWKDYVIPKELDVSAKLDVGEKSYFGVNQRARVERRSGPTAIADRVNEKLAGLSSEQRQRGLPNGDKYDAHAEIHGIQQVIEAGTGNGQHAKMVVNGERICTNCHTDIPAAAEKAGFASLTIFEKQSGKTFIWKPGMTELQEVKQ